MTAIDESSSILSFIEITGVDTVQTARDFLDATNWKLDEAIQLFFVSGSKNQRSVPSHDNSSWNDVNNPPLMEENHQSNSSPSHNNSSWDDNINPPLSVRREALPLPVRREALYGNGYNEMQQEDEEDDSLGWMYPLPDKLTFKGTFEKAKQVASMKEKWLLVNLQSKKEFSSHMLNRDTWSNEGVAQIIQKNFIFLQVTDDTIEGMKFSTYYKLLGSTPPVVLLLDPITGQKMCSWNGMIEGERLLEELVPFMDASIKGKQLNILHRHHQHQQQPRETIDHQRTTVNQKAEEAKELMLAIALLMEKTLCPSTSTNTEMDKESPSLSELEKEEEEETCLMEEEEKRTTTYPALPEEPKTVEEEEEETCLMEEEEEKGITTYPALPEEPKTVDRKLVCRVGFRLPQDGRRVQRCFLRTDPIQLLWSFIISQLDEVEVSRPFRLTVAPSIPGAVAKVLYYESKLSFEESGLSNSMVSVTWDD